MLGKISITGARENNLKGVDVDIPWHKITVVTGLSGSGKSSLAFDTLYAEGLRRYVECLSTYARQFFERVDKPDMDDIQGLPPVIAIESKNTVRSSRSTVGTSTEIYDYIVLLFAKVGRIYCPSCGREVSRQGPGRIADSLIEEYPGERAVITFRAVNGDITPASLLARGYTRVLHEGEPVDIEDSTDLPPELNVIVDRVVIGAEGRTRIAEAVEGAFAESGAVRVNMKSGPALNFSSGLECPYCPQIGFTEPTPLLFSFNNPHGACPVCRGFGNTLELDPELLIPDPGKSLDEGAVAPLEMGSLKKRKRQMHEFAGEHGIDTTIPYKSLSASAKKALFEGGRGFPGIRGVFAHLEKKTYKLHVRVFLSRYRSTFPCTRCGGSRLKPAAGWVRINGKTITELTRMPVDELDRLLGGLTLEGKDAEVAGEVLRQLRARVGFLARVGLEYLTLSRESRTLSGGEAQRVNLASQLGSSLTDTLYIMDEPSVGLHPRDISRLISIMKELRDRDNTVVVVEHDLDIMRSSDNIVELGPGAGEHGGEVIYQGELSRFLSSPDGSITGAYMTGRTRIEVPAKRRPIKGAKIRVTGARENNLKDISVSVPLRTLTCITGVSGSGKSTLVHDILYAAMTRALDSTAVKPGIHKRVLGTDKVREVSLLDQTPIGRSSRSNPVTYIKAFDEIRRLLASTREAVNAGFTPSTFSFNVPGGRCDECDGEGQMTIEMVFLADVKIACERCGGKRYKSEVLDIRYRGRGVHDILAMTITEAIGFFADVPGLVRKLTVLDDVGLGYLRLGQPAPTLSAGEAQRMKIGRELARRDGSDILYILDEPTVGLHLDDIRKLIAVLNKLVDAGNTVLVIEHNLDLVKCADYVIDLGPEGGEGGGYLVGAGRPEDIARLEGSYTGTYLAKLLGC